MLPQNEIIHGACIEILKNFPDNSFDLIFAYPPYNLQLPENRKLLRENAAEVIPVNDEWNNLAETELEINSYIKAFLIQLQLAGSLEMNFQYNYLSTLPTGRLTREKLDSKQTVEGIVSGIKHLD